MKITIIVALAVVALLIVGVLSLNFDLAPEPRVEITSFNTTGTSSGSSIGAVNAWFVLNLTNSGTGYVENLTVTFSANNTIESNKQLIYTNSTSPYDHIADFEIGEMCLLGDLKAKETKDFRFYWAISVDFDASPLTATLKSNEAILDQATETIPAIPHVKITNFIFTGSFHGTTLGPMRDLFSLSYTNFGMSDVDNLIVALNTSKTDPYPRPTPNPTYHPYRLLDETINGDNYPLESLNAGETKTFEKSYFMDMGFLKIEPFALTATLKSNDTILDQPTILIPNRDSDIRYEYIG